MNDSFGPSLRPHAAMKPSNTPIATLSSLTPVFKLMVLGMGLSLLALGLPRVYAADHGAEHTPAPAASKPAVKKAGTSPPEEAPLVDIKAALREQMTGKKKVTLVISDKPEAKSAAASSHSTTAKPAAAHEPEPVAAKATAVAHAAVSHSSPVVNPRASREYIRAKAAALTGHEAPAGSADAHGSEVNLMSAPSANANPPSTLKSLPPCKGRQSRFSSTTPHPAVPWSTTATRFRSIWRATTA